MRILAVSNTGQPALAARFKAARDQSKKNSSKGSRFSKADLLSPDGRFIYDSAGVNPGIRRGGDEFETRRTRVLVKSKSGGVFTRLNVASYSV
jgi:hypothetical protein